MRRAVNLAVAAVVESLESRCLLSAAVPTFSSATSPTGKAPTSIAVGDFNKDGKLDYISANSKSGTVTVGLGKGTGQFGSQQQIGVGSSPFAVTVADFNKDTNLDFAVALQGSNQIAVYLGNGAGAFSKSALVSAGKLAITQGNDYGTGSKLVTGDFNGDAKLDMAVTNNVDNTVSVMLGKGDGTFNARVATATPKAFALVGLAAADFNKDGKTDLAVTGYVNLDILFGSTAGKFTPGQSFGYLAANDDGTLSDAHDVIAADLNKDGFLDLAVVNGDLDSVAIFKGAAGGTFAYDQSNGVGVGGNRGPVALAAGDFNKDGFPELAIANPTSGTRTILINDGTGHFFGAVNSETPTFIDEIPVYATAAEVTRDVEVGDFNNDGKLDILFAADGANGLIILTNTTTGNPVFAPVISSFTVTPGTAAVGSTLTLTATANETNGQITGVKFYDGGNPQSIGTGTLVNGVWTLSVNTAGYAVRNHAFYAVATDANGVSGSVSTQVAITASNNTPTITRFDGPVDVYIGDTIELAVTAIETGGTISKVTFYRESNGTGDLEIGGDTLLGTGTFANGVWNFDAAAGNTPNYLAFYAVATDANGIDSAPALHTVGVNNFEPAVYNFTATPSSTTSGSTVLLSAKAVGDIFDDDDSGVTSVTFYRESNGNNGLQVGSDTLVSGANHSNGVWSISTSTAGLPAGTYIYYATETDVHGVNNAQASTTVTLTAAPVVPVINSFTITPSTFTVGTAMQLTANATETNGTIANVKFYIDVDGTPGLNPNTDFFLGTATSGTSTFTLTANTNGYTPGTYTVYAYATDSTGKTAQKSAVITATAATQPAAGTLLAWEVGAQTGGGTAGLKASTVATGDTNSLGLTKGSGLKSATASKAWGASGWAATSAAGISGNKFVTFGLTVASGFKTSLSSIDLRYRRSSDGPANVLLQYQLNNGAWITVSDVTSAFPDTSSSGGNATLNLAGVASLQNIAAGTSVNFRLTPYGATASTATWYIYNQTGNDLVIKGSTTATP